VQKTLSASLGRYIVRRGLSPTRNQRTANITQEEKMSDEKKVAVEAPVQQAVETMSHRQLRAELKRAANKPYAGKGFVMGGVDFGDTKKKTNAGLDNALAAALGIVLDNTKIEPTGRFSKKRKPRVDQIGPGKLNSYLV
jgi:hypothetical protein